jgi:hypothetical protein
MLYNSCTGIYKFGNNTYPRPIRRRSNLDHIFGNKLRLKGREIRNIKKDSNRNESTEFLLKKMMVKHTGLSKFFGGRTSYKFTTFLLVISDAF